MEGQGLETQVQMNPNLESILFAMEGTGEVSGGAFAELKEKAFAPVAEQEQVQQEEQPVNLLAGQETQEEVTPVEAVEPVAETVKKDEVEAESLLDSPLMKMAKPKTEEDQGIGSVEGLDKINELVAKEFTDIKDFPSLMESYKELSGRLSDYDTVKKKSEELINGLSSLPPDLIKAIELAELGQDYRQYIAGMPSIDFKKDAESIDKIDLIKAYFPDKLTADDIEAMDENSDYYDPKAARLVDALHERAVEKFNAEKKSFDGQAEAYLRKEDERNEVYSNSVRNSLSSVKESFPDAPASYVKSIEEKLMNNGIASLFYDENGLLKADAAARFVMASDDGKNLVTQLQRIAHEKAKTEANLDILTKGQRTAPSTSARTMGKADLGDKAKSYVEGLLGGMNSSKHF